MGATLVVPKKEWYWSASLVRQLRGKRSLAEFASLLGVPKRTVSLWEANRGPTPDYAKLSALSLREGFNTGRKLRGSIAWVSEDLGKGDAFISNLFRESLERTAKEL